MPVMQSQTRAEALNRLRYIEGHLAAVRRMVEAERYCVDVLEQSHAVRRAMQKFEAVLLDGHLHNCVVDGIQGGEDDAVVGELLRLYELANK